jgi:uroporphyrinogen-III decarboxylase
MTGWIHENTDWKVFKHCCGAITPLIPELIDAGFDILNPVQCSADGMDPKMLKDTFGDRIVFWGGGVDTQSKLPFGKPEEVAEQVRSRIDIFNKDGGFMFNTVHNVQAGTPIENFLAMADVIKDLAKENY